MVRDDQNVDEREFLKNKTNQENPWAEGMIIPKDESGIDRRKGERIEVGVRVEFDEEHWGFTHNLSMKGAFVLTPAPLDLEDKFLLKLYIPDGGEPIPVTCKVVWTNQYGKESDELRRGMGISFLKLKHEDQKRIEEYIQAYKAKTLVMKDGKTMIIA
jgi:Tfp pilus assembly protein PilZ